MFLCSAKSTVVVCLGGCGHFVLVTPHGLELLVACTMEISSCTSATAFVLPKLSAEPRCTWARGSTTGLRHSASSSVEVRRDHPNSLLAYVGRQDLPSRKSGAKSLSMGGGSVLPHPVAAASKLRDSSSTSRLEDGDGVVIVDHGSRRAQSNAMLQEFVKIYQEETGHKLVEAAHMELASPTIADAFDRCVEQGAARVIICPYFLFPGRHWDKDIPALAAEAAQKHPEISYLVTAPIGLHKLMVTVIRDRMEYCLSQTAGKVSECDMCKGTGRCRQLTNAESPSATTDASGGSVGTSTPNR